MFALIKKIFFRLLTSTLSASNHIKCVSLMKQKIGINESRILTKHILCKCECKFDDKNVT